MGLYWFLSSDCHLVQ